MTPKEKAIELRKKIYQPIFDIDLGIDVSKDQKRYYASKKCALIAVDEVLKSIDWDYYEGSSATELNWWKEVKHEIEKL